MTRENTIYVRYIKYMIAKIIAAVLIILFWWVYVICALAVVISSGFPIIYKQERVGQRGKLYKIYKYRTMVKNADKIGPTSTSANDSRITKVGAFLRKTSLDEIPQLFNIIRGDMGFIGYRPDVVRENDDYSQNKYLLKPGITGLAQVNGRSSLTPEEKHDWENSYLDVVSFTTDMKIIFRTICVVLSRKGSN